MSIRKNKSIPSTVKILFVLIAFNLLSADVFSSQSSSLKADKAFVDFGTVREGIKAPVSFTLSNPGTVEVSILQIRTFAACVQAQPLAKSTLSPGESLKLEYVFESLGYGGVSIDKKIEIHYNNPDKSPLTLKVKGKVLPLESYQAPIGEMTYNFFVLIDTRTPGEFLKEHIIGAINVPADKIDIWAAAAAKTLSKEVIIYLYSIDGKESDKRARRLRQKGFPQYISLVGGLKEWKKQNGVKNLISGKI